MRRAQDEPALDPVVDEIDVHEPGELRLVWIEIGAGFAEVVAGLVLDRIGWWGLGAVVMALGALLVASGLAAMAGHGAARRLSSLACFVGYAGFACPGVMILFVALPTGWLEGALAGLAGLALGTPAILVEHAVIRRQRG